MAGFQDSESTRTMHIYELLITSSRAATARFLRIARRLPCSVETPFTDSPPKLLVVSRCVARANVTYSGVCLLPLKRPCGVHQRRNMYPKQKVNHSLETLGPASGPGYCSVTTTLQTTACPSQDISYSRACLRGHLLRPRTLAFNPEYSEDKMSPTTHQARSVPLGPPSGAQSLQRMPSSDSYFYQQPPTMQPYPMQEYRPQSLAYAMTINPSEVNTSRIPPGGDFSGSMTSVEPLLSQQEAQGTLESPFSSNVLQRGISNHSTASESQPATDDTSAASSPTPSEEAESTLTVIEKEAKPVVSPPISIEKPPRPPNAWILYRSERLRAIAAGEPIPGLLAVLEAQSLVRALDVSEQRVSGTKESSSSPEPNRFQLFKDAEPPSPESQKSVKEDSKTENGSKYRRALLQADISKVISMMWKREDKEVKAKYEAMAEAKKLEVGLGFEVRLRICNSPCSSQHQQKYPNYKYQPMRKEEKLKQQEQIKAEKERLKREAMAEKARK